ncbi:NAD-dependent protein deacetylase HST1-like protein [Quillaja saponaria]|uniref:Protein TILLER ANGLE CONTROL 1 n=1 Tax=Quillaja saponaria TaxID=32244 RepID=A0AAD7PDA9_QUISA|nr:NAD-dependent protein deacetylase HST1-like protein [Quillaja saponaria]
MKIFNWVNRRFHKDGFTSNENKKIKANDHIDTQALLEQVALVDVLGGWSDGILTIGTLGYDPLKSSNQQKEYLVFYSDREKQDQHEGEEFLLDGDDDHDDDDLKKDDEELNPLMFTTLEHNFEDVILDNDVNPHELVVSSLEVIESNNTPGITDQNKNKEERITLADLFLADSDVKVKLDPSKVFLDPKQKSHFKKKHGLSFVNKLIPQRVKDDINPIKNLKRVMGRMLNRKIHPEVDAKVNKTDGQNSSRVGNNSSTEHDESVLLLPTQGASM